ncbi:hypothetical protein AB833_04940 [Chromatiales bacterium (ex Bugula neritina AB1)]|nr:hypothetical protein AB833_04940 [Chromatiales bacterium (ex Bugula neritina AB1)]
MPLENKWTWGGIDVVKWRYLPEFAGGDKNLLRNYKNAWVINHSSSIKEQAKKYGISVILLAGVCWIEVGGDPDWIDSIAYPIRSFDHMADPLLEPFTITKKPELTSMGDVSIQLRRAAEAANLDFAKLNSEQKNQLIECLSDEDVNIAFVAKHLSQLKEVDEVCFLADEELRIIGARYNRGPHLSLEQIKLNTSYGEFILKKKSDLKALLQQ